jgi:hypothetical protein
MNRWRLQNGRYVENLDRPELIACQPLQGPATRIMSALLERMADGPCFPTATERAEMDRLEAINYGY